VFLWIGDPGANLLVAPTQDAAFNIDRHVAFDWNLKGTNHPDQTSRLANVRSAGKQYRTYMPFLKMAHDAGVLEQMTEPPALEAITGDVPQ